ncbi:MAG: AtpZ/AtpI family protein [Thermoguttaceae bacterium]
MNNSRDDRSAWAMAIEWSSRLTAIGLEMALPGLGGYGLDRWLGTLPVCLILGVSLGFSLGMFELVRLARPARRKADNGDPHC